MEELHKSSVLPSAATANGDAAGMGAAAAQKWTDSHMSYVARLGQHQNALQQVSERGEGDAIKQEGNGPKDQRATRACCSGLKRPTLSYFRKSWS